MKTRIIVYVCLFLLLCVGLIYVVKKKQPPTGLSTGSRTHTIEEEEFETVDDREQISHVIVAESSPGRLVLEISLQDWNFIPVEMPDGRVYTNIIDPGSSSSEVGRPNVPVFGNLILIPNGTEPVLEVDLGEPIIYEDIDLAPAQPPLADIEDEVIRTYFAKNEEVYSSDSDYPGVFAQLEPTRTMRGQECTTIWLYPYQYNPVIRTLTVYPDLMVTVWFDGELRPISANLKDESFRLILRRIALNADNVFLAEDEIEELIEEHPAPSGTYGWNYIIITHPKFLKSAKKFADWKRKCGYKTLLVTKPTGWQTKDIKNALQKAYDNWDIKPRYVLLIGDSEYIPTNYKTWHPFNGDTYKGQKNTQGYTATDIYFVTMDGPDDIGADIAIGRLSVDAESEAEERIKGIINYEKNPPLKNSFYNTAAICSYFQDGGTLELEMPNGKIVYKELKLDGTADRRYAQTSEDIAVLLTDSKYKINKSVKRIYFTEEDVTPAKWANKYFEGLAGKPGDPIPKNLLRKNGFAWKGNTNDITAAVKYGCFLLTHRDHGGSQRWSHPSYEWSEAFLWENYSLLPVVWSFNCQTGWFDNETDFKKKPGIKDLTQSNEESFSEYLERPAYGAYGDCGAVGIISCTRVSYSGPGDRLFLGVANAIWPGNINKPPKGILVDPTLKMGDVLMLGKLYVESNSSNDIYRKAVLEGFLWFGDPAMEIRTEKPRLIIANIPRVWPWVLRPNELVIHVGLDVTDSDDPILTDEIPTPLEGVTVTISKADNPSDYWVGKADKNGDVIFPDFIASELGEYDIVVTAPNSIPFQGTIMSEVGPAGGILLNINLSEVEAEVEVKLADVDLAGMEEQEVLVFTSGGDEENVVLREKDLQTGMFVGEISTIFGDAVPGDGILQVQEGEMILVDYYDENDGSGTPVNVHDEKLFEPEPPVFEGIDYIMVDSNVVEL